MERFRELEKEFKMKQYSKKALLNANNSENYDSDSDGGDYGDDNDSMGEDLIGEEEEVKAVEEPMVNDKEWLQEFMQEHFKGLIIKLETELETSKNKKVKGTSKKQKEKIGGMTYKLT